MNKLRENIAEIVGNINVATPNKSYEIGRTVDLILALFPSEPKECDSKDFPKCREALAELSSLKARMEVGEIKEIFGNSKMPFHHDYNCPVREGERFDEGDAYRECTCSELNDFATAIVKYLKGERV